MIVIIILQALALLLLIIGWVMFLGLPDSRTIPGKKVRWMLLVPAVLIIATLGVVATIKTSEATGMETALSGGLKSDARQWISRNAPERPVLSQPGDNIKMVREGRAFVRSHAEVARLPEAQAALQTYSGLPDQATRLLSHDEEQQYYEAAQAFYRIISAAAEKPE